ncbi:MAG: response regulator [Pseudomonadota bacterium]
MLQWLQHFSIRSKVLLIAGTGIGLFAIYYAFSFIGSTHTADLVTHIHRVNFATIESLGRNDLEIVDIREKFYAAINEEDQATLDEATQLAAQMRQRIVGLPKIDPDIKTDADALLGKFDAYFGAASGLAHGMLDGSITSDQLYAEITRMRAMLDVFMASQAGLRKLQDAQFHENLEAAARYTDRMRLVGLGIGAVGILILVILSVATIRGVTAALANAIQTAERIAGGDWDFDMEIRSRDETGKLLQAMAHMRDALKRKRDEDRRIERRKTQLAELNDRMRGDLTTDQLANNVLTYLVQALEAQVGAFYMYDEEGRKLRLVSSYAFTRRKSVTNEYGLGESLVGQAALEQKQILLTNVPDGYITVSSGLGETTPRHVAVTPIVHDKELKAVIEVAALRPFAEDDMALLESAVEAIAISLNTAQSRVKLASFVDELQGKTDELERQKVALHKVNEDLEHQAMELSASEAKLQAQQEELRATNEELEAQAQALRASEESLQAQQEELRVTNEELEEQARLLAGQKQEMARQNEQLEQAKLILEEKNNALEMSSKYKSEFLSTMSHELRTPLNSILILSNALAENKKGNLLDKQIEHARVIHSAGSDLLSLINDILDLSKVESGKMSLVIDEINLRELSQHMIRSFRHVAENRGITFDVDVMDPLPSENIFTDRQRLEQVLRNMFSNAFKFTHKGGVTLTIRKPDPAKLAEGNLLARIDVDRMVAFEVRDTGIGIPKDKQQVIFEAFQQADGTTSRKYGGTGLGLTISRELSHLLGGEIQLVSEENQGSTFIIYVPVGDADQVQKDEEAGSFEARLAALAQQYEKAEKKNDAAAAGAAGEGGGEEQFTVKEKTVLIVEDDADFAKILGQLAEDYGLESVVCEDGESGLEYARKYRPSAIILDVGLPGISGWDVMEKLKDDPRTRGIPVHFLSGDDQRGKALKMGAIDFLTKPVNKDQIVNAFHKIEGAISKNVRKLLVVEDNEHAHAGLRELFDQKGVEIKLVSTGEEAFAALRGDVFDCMILDLTLPDINGLELLERLHADESASAMPVIVYTGKDLTREEDQQLRKYADRIILKTERSAERLLNEASLFLHWLEANLPTGGVGKKVDKVDHRESIFAGKKVLVVDDDMRNIYAMSASLEEMGFEITIANNGVEALEAVGQNPDFDLVLMDIMMPEMDGYEAMRRIRAQEQFKSLPMIALTAKAMKEDRAKCIEAGANDYCSKPVDMEKLTALMRVWLHKA